MFTTKLHQLPIHCRAIRFCNGSATKNVRDIRWIGSKTKPNCRKYELLVDNSRKISSIKRNFESIEQSYGDYRDRQPGTCWSAGRIKRNKCNSIVITWSSNITSPLDSMERTEWWSSSYSCCKWQDWTIDYHGHSWRRECWCCLSTHPWLSQVFPTSWWA